MELPLGAAPPTRVYLTRLLAIVVVVCATLSSRGLRADNLVAPATTVVQNNGGLANGYIFIAPNGSGQGQAGQTVVNCAEIIDNQGRTVWMMPYTAPGELATDFRVQTYQGKPVITWTQGVGFAITQVGATTDYIADTSYHVVATVQAGNGLNADGHEFALTPQNTALITIYHDMPCDLSSVGGPVNGTLREGALQEIDVATGKVLLEWHSYPNIALSESHYPVPTTSGQVYDYCHINSVNVDTDGNLLVSCRYMWTVYKINRTTGAIMWRLGGKKSDYALGPGVQFAYQHNAMAVDGTTIRLFDNEQDEDGNPPVEPASRVIWLSHNDTAKTVTLLQSFQHPLGISAAAQGNGQALPNGNTFVGWGFAGRISEFGPAGQLLFDATLAGGYATYRAYRFPWVGNPTTSPTAVVQDNGNGTLTVHAVWNGATAVATWQVTGGSGPGSIAVAASAPWNGMDTAITVPGPLANVQVVALDSSGAVIGTSGAPAVVAQTASVTVAGGGTAAFDFQATGPAVAYQWSLNGSPLANSATVSGANGPVLLITGATSANAGTYSCTATNSAGTVASSATLTVAAGAAPGRLTNYSVLANVSGSLTAGFVIGGSGTNGSENLLIRAMGPALATSFGLSGVLPDPTLTVVQQANHAMMASNSGMGSLGSNVAQINAADAATGAFALTGPSSGDAAVVTSLPASAGGYGVQVKGKSGDNGLALTEVYDNTSNYTPSSPRLVNLSCLTSIASGSGLTLGFVVGGTTAKTVLVRASGPALSALGVGNALADPQITVEALGSSTVLATDAGWAGNAQISSAANAVGAFKFTNSSSLDSAVLLTVAPGAYTAQVSSVSGSSGAVLIEVYEVP